MNLYLITPDLVEFNIWNLNYLTIEGHYTFYYNIKTRKYRLRKMGDFGGLTYIRPVTEALREATAAGHETLAEHIAERLYSAFHYDGGWHAGGCSRPLMPDNTASNVGGYKVFEFDYHGLESEESKAYAAEAVKLLT